VDAAVLVGLGLYAAALWWLSRRSQTSEKLEYLLAGRRLTLLPFVATLVSTWYGGVLGVGEYSFRYGISNWLVFGLPYYLAALLFAFFLAARARRSAALSIPEQLTAAYGPVTGRLGAGLVLLLAVPAAYSLMLGELVRLYVDTSLPVAVAVATAFTVAVALAGGFRTVVAANALQFVLMYLGFAVLLPVAVGQAGGFASLWHALPESHRLWDGGLGLQAVLVWYFIALQTLVEPTFFQRCYAAASPAVARTGILVSVAFWVLFDFLTTFSGLAARVLLPATTDPVLAYPALGRLVLSPAANALFVVGMVATVMSTLHSYLFLAAATIGHDVVPNLASRVDERRSMMLGLVGVGVVATAMALAFGSVVAIWHDIGSIVTAALLLPLMASHASAPWRYQPRWAAAAVVTAALLATGWILARGPDGRYLWGLEPIFPALAASALCWVLGRVTSRR
jgi:solute:Na+ symporter, SSS family